MHFLASGTSGLDPLLSKHYKRFLASRGSFGSLRRRLSHSPRWQWYSNLMLLKKIPTEPLPLINFVDDTDGRAKKLVLSLLNVNAGLTPEDGFISFLVFCDCSLRDLLLQIRDF